MRPARLLAAGVALSLAAAGCGDDSSGETTAPSISIPAVTAPSTPTVPTEEPTGGVRPEATTTTKPQTHDPSKPDSPENDVPPPPGSPQEAFEKQCQQNPAACG